MKWLLQACLSALRGARWLCKVVSALSLVRSDWRIMEKLARSYNDMQAAAFNWVSLCWTFKSCQMLSEVYFFMFEKFIMKIDDECSRSFAFSSCNTPSWSLSTLSLSLLVPMRTLTSQRQVDNGKWQPFYLVACSVCWWEKIAFLFN